MRIDRIPKVKPIVYGDEELDLNELLRCTYDDIGDAAVEIPAAVEWLNEVLHYYLQTKVNDAAELTRVKAEAYRKLRDGGYAAAYTDKMTEAALDRAVAIDPTVRQGNANVAESEAAVERLRNTIRNLTTRLDILRTVESTRRHVDRVSGEIR